MGGGGLCVWWGCCRPEGIPPFHLTRGVLGRQSACGEQLGGSPWGIPTGALTCKPDTHTLIQTERGVLSGYGMVRIKGGLGSKLGKQRHELCPSQAHRQKSHQSPVLQGLCTPCW